MLHKYNNNFKRLSNIWNSSSRLANICFYLFCLSSPWFLLPITYLISSMTSDLFPISHGQFYCTLLYCTSQMLHFFTNWRQVAPSAKGLWLALLPHWLYRGRRMGWVWNCTYNVFEVCLKLSERVLLWLKLWGKWGKGILRCTSFSLK